MTISDLYINLFGRSHIKDGNVIDMAEHGRVGGVSTGQPFKFVVPIDPTTGSTITPSSAYTIKITESGNYTYVAKANPGTAQSAASWQAFRIDETTGMILLWADGDALFNNVATDLTALSYS